MSGNRSAEPIAEILSPREKELLDFAVQGQTDQAIANKLGISLATVGTYWGRVRIKLGPYNRTELVALYLKDEAGRALEDVKQQNSELVSSISEHAQKEAMLESSLQMFRALIETAPDAILLVSAGGRIELANAQASEMFGYAEDELKGMEVERLIPSRYHEAHRENRSEYLQNPVRKNMGEHVGTVAVKKDGTEFPVAAALNATDTLQGRLVTCILRLVAR